MLDDGIFYGKSKNFNMCCHIWPEDIKLKKHYSENIHVYIPCSFKNNSSG